MNERFGTPAVLALGVVLGWMASSWEPASVRAQVESGVTAGRSGDLIALTAGPQGSDSIVLIDARRKVLSIYDFREKRLKLVGARRFAADHELSEYNNADPHVSDIERLIDQRAP